MQRLLEGKSFVLARDQTLANQSIVTKVKKYRHLNSGQYFFDLTWNLMRGMFVFSF
jgi:hypothetical protein